jgi:hypothetical protein
MKTNTFYKATVENPYYQRGGAPHGSSMVNELRNDVEYVILDVTINDSGIIMPYYNQESVFRDLIGAKVKTIGVE